MSNDLWLPNGYELNGGVKIRQRLYAGEEWQIFDTSQSIHVLIVVAELVEKWHENDFLDISLFDEVAFGPQSFRILVCPKNYILVPVNSRKSPDDLVDGLSFAHALSESRRLSADASFHDAVFVEQYSRLLPVWSLTPNVDDDVVLGTWITGGVEISAQSFRRLTRLAGWMQADDLAEIIKTAGLEVPADYEVMMKRRSNSSAKTSMKSGSGRSIGKPESSPLPGKAAIPKIFELPGRPQLESFFNEHIIDIIFNAEKYRSLGIDFPSAVVLHGPPGSGKTYAVERLVEFIDWPCYSIDSSSIGSPYIHETGRKISEIFNKAIDEAPSVIIIDEMEAFLSDRSLAGLSGLHRVEEVAEFLRRIPEAIKNKVLVIAMTNMIGMIDPAILRRGRFDHIIEVGMPSREEVVSLFDSLLSKLPKTDNLSVDKVIDALTGRALSDSAFVVREAARLAARTGKTQLDQESLEMALNSLPK